MSTQRTEIVTFASGNAWKKSNLKVLQPGNLKLGQQQEGKLWYIERPYYSNQLTVELGRIFNSDRSKKVIEFPNAIDLTKTPQEIQQELLRFPAIWKALELGVQFALVEVGNYGNVVLSSECIKNN